MMRVVVFVVASGALALCGCDKQGDQTGSASNAQGPTAVTPGLPAAPTGASAAAPTPAGPALGQAMDSKGELRMDVLEAVRTGGVLTVKTRFTLIGGKPASRPLPGSSTSDVYLTAADKKYMMLTDDRDKALMSSNSYPSFDQVGSLQTWWAKFPAPSAEVKAVNFYFYGFDPVENVAIADR
jgi:hypothetical protein